MDPDGVARAIGPQTALISIMLANNETGTLQPIKEISEVARRRGVPVHTDAAQALGKIPVDVNALGVDFLTVAGHKLYGPKGVGALFIRQGKTLTPLMHGAAQEGGRRAGTENTILVVGLGAAARVARERLDHDPEAMAAMRDRLQFLLFEGVQDLVLNGHPSARLPNTLNVSVPGVEGGRILDGLPGLMASTGAACHDRSVTLSHVLAAMKVPPRIGMGALRLTVGRSNTMAQMDEAARMIIGRIKRLKEESRVIMEKPVCLPSFDAAPLNPFPDCVDCLAGLAQSAVAMVSGNDPDHDPSCQRHGQRDHWRQCVIARSARPRSPTES